jgi:hypothetical protein
MAVKPGASIYDRPVDEEKTDVASGKTLGVTARLRLDIIEFLSSKHTANATVSVDEIMRLYKCPEDRAKRVIAALIDDKVLRPAGNGVYQVMI